MKTVLLVWGISLIALMFAYAQLVMNKDHAGYFALAFALIALIITIRDGWWKR